MHLNHTNWIRWQTIRHIFFVFLWQLQKLQLFWPLHFSVFVTWRADGSVRNNNSVFMAAAAAACSGAQALFFVCIDLCVRSRLARLPFRRELGSSSEGTRGKKHPSWDFLLPLLRSRLTSCDNYTGTDPLWRHQSIGLILRVHSSHVFDSIFFSPSTQTHA